ncbi:hypothetical protein BGX38DRAFT_1150659 [Terfezia claveryi]|nr:hypothetical protein BGX38DRAFT_1150659 [Terfezia claveryi]
MASNGSNWAEAAKYLRAVVDRFQTTEGIEYEVVGKIEGQEQPSGNMLVLDSSFNPPTRGHMSMIISALRTPTTDEYTPNSQCTRYSRILLLLAVQNADKTPQPASFGDRLAMMLLFAEDIHSAARDTGLSILPVEVGVIKHARFLDKAITLRKVYPEGAEMVFLTGFDTLIRFFDPKYYGGTLAPLAPFFEKGNSIQCCLRPMEGGSGEWKWEQEMFLEEIKGGKRERDGCPREWGRRVQMMDHGLVVPVSSTLVREALINEDEGVLKNMLTEGVRKWILQRGVYRDRKPL